MIKKGKHKKGATLIELTVVLAVISIILTMVVSFSVFLGERTKTSVKANSLMQDVTFIKTAFETWVDECIKEDAQISCDNGVLTATKGEQTYDMQIQEKVLTAKFPSQTYTSQTYNYNLEVVERWSFEMFENQSQTLYVCKVFYSLNNVEQNFVFTFNPYVGDVVQGGV